jgi:hypothetical protein
MPWLTGCGLRLQRVDPPRPEVVQVPVPAYRALPHELTDPLPLPTMPPAKCRDANGQPAICLIDALDAIPGLQALLDLANADRARAAALGKTDVGAKP